MHQMPSPFDPPPTRQTPAGRDRFSGMTASMPMMHDPHEGRHVSPSQLVAQDKHWSGVAKGELFIIILEFDPNVYEQQNVQVRLRRNAETGLTESAEHQWRWAVQSPFGEGRKKVIAAAKASGWFTPLRRPDAPEEVVEEDEETASARRLLNFPQRKKEKSRHADEAAEAVETLLAMEGFEERARQGHGQGEVPKTPKRARQEIWAAVDAKAAEEKAFDGRGVVEI